MTNRNPQFAQDPHAGTPTLRAGVAASAARVGLVLLHGRGGRAEDMLRLGRVVTDGLSDVAIVAPQAADDTWYPHSFLAPIERNQPHLHSALVRIDREVEALRKAGLLESRVVVAGFSQGACLASEFVAGHPRPWGGIGVLCGGRPGPLGTPLEPIEAELHGTPAYFAGVDPDPHVPYARVAETAGQFRAAGAAVTLRRYPGEPHAINADMLAELRRLIDGVPG